MDESLRRMKRRALQTGDPADLWAYAQMLERMAGVGEGNPEINSVQRMYMELIHERYPEFARDLEVAKNHWHGAVLTRSYSYLEYTHLSNASAGSYHYAPAHYPLIVLRDLEQDYLNQDAVYILVKDDKKSLDAIRHLADWHDADEYNEYHSDTHEDFVFTLFGGIPKGVPVRIWWD